MADPMPRTVVAGYRIYRVTQDRDAVPVEDRRTLDDYAGRSLHAAGVVWVAPDMSERDQRETFLHELMHCGLASAGVQGTLRIAAKAEADTGPGPEEVYVAATASTLLALLDSNPAVRRYLWPAG